MIPSFNDHGFLPEGIHEATHREFSDRFLIGPEREVYLEPISSLISYARHYGAESIIFGGSFVSEKPNPNDVDCVLIFKNQSQIPPRIASVEIEGCGLDIFFASLDQDYIVSSFVHLLSLNWYEDLVGIVRIILSQSNKDLTTLFPPDPDLFSAIRQTYTKRRIVSKNNRKRALITIHGIRTSADWNAEVCLNASANGWIAAPFNYGYVEATIFANMSQRREIVDKFREFAIRINKDFNVDDISVLAHSFGTYILMSYINGFNDTPVRFGTAILTGAILNENIDLSVLSNRVSMFVNEKAPNDEWAGKAKIANFGQDKLFGKAGINGFSSAHQNLIQSSSDIFTHNNVIKRDVIVQRWLPTLEAFCGTMRRKSKDRQNYPF